MVLQVVGGKLDLRENVRSKVHFGFLGTSVFGAISAGRDVLGSIRPKFITYYSNNILFKELLRHWQLIYLKKRSART